PIKTSPQPPPKEGELGPKQYKMRHRQRGGISLEQTTILRNNIPSPLGRVRVGTPYATLTVLFYGTIGGKKLRRRFPPKPLRSGPTDNVRPHKYDLGQIIRAKYRRARTTSIYA